MISKEIQNYDGYRIFEDGTIESNVRNRDKNKYYVMKQQNHNGYKTIMLRSNEGKAEIFRVHRLVAMAFVENPNNYTIINHIDGVKNNNHFSNLEWCTYGMNNKHAFDTKLKENKKSYTRDEEIEIIKLRKSGLRAKDIQKIFPHLKIYVIQKLYEKYGLTRKIKDTSKFSILEKKEIKYKLINRTESVTDISKKIGIDRRTAGRIINELIWKEIVL